MTNRFREKKTGSKREERRQQQEKSEEEKEDCRGRSRTKEMRNGNNNIRTENDFLTINHDYSIDSLL